MPITSQNLKTALVHDWLTEIGGAERVLKAIHRIFPEAPIYVFFHDKKFTDNFLPKARIIPSKYQNLYRRFLGRKLMLPFLPLAAESIDLSGYDLVISTGSFAKGLVLRPATTHISYCHSPTRQLWDWQSEYSRENHKMPRWTILSFQHFFRIWDRNAASRADHFIANSQNTRSRVKKYYNRDSTVICPPVEILDNDCNGIVARYSHYNLQFLIVSRLFPHKNIAIAVKAFNRLGWPLNIIGDGPEMEKLKPIAEKNVKFLGHLSDSKVQKNYAKCTAFIMPQEEDFGIAPLEAMAYGKPVLALKQGGALEYIKEGINGEFFEEPREEMLADGVRRLVANLSNYDPEKIKETARKFSFKRFKLEIEKFINNVIQS